MGKTPGLDGLLKSTLAKIDKQIRVIQEDAVTTKAALDASFEMDVKHDEYMETDSNGQFKMIPLILARSNVLLAIALNNQKA